MALLVREQQLPRIEVTRAIKMGGRAGMGQEMKQKR